MLIGDCPGRLGAQEQSGSPGAEREGQAGEGAPCPPCGTAAFPRHSGGVHPQDFVQREIRFPYFEQQWRAEHNLYGIYYSRSYNHKLSLQEIFQPKHLNTPPTTTTTVPLIATLPPSRTKPPPRSRAPRRCGADQARRAHPCSSGAAEPFTRSAPR